MPSAIAEKEDRIPIYKTIASELRGQIVSGVLRPGQRIASISELQKVFGTTKATVDHGLSALEQDGLIVRRNGRGIFVAEVQPRELQYVIGYGHNFSAAETQADIGPPQPYWTELISALVSECRAHGFDLMFINPSERGWKKIDAVIAYGDAGAVIVADKPAGVPAVQLMVPVADVCCFVADDFGAAKALTEHLLMLGHRRIGALMWVETVIGRRRLDGYRSALYENGIQPDPAWVRPLHIVNTNVVRELGIENMTSWIADGFRELGCTALIVQNDSIAVGVMAAVADAGYSVPADLSIGAIDNTDEARTAVPRLTSVDIELSSIGRAAIRHLVAHIHGAPSVASVITMNSRLEVRSSTGPPPSQ